MKPRTGAFWLLSLTEKLVSINVRRGAGNHVKPKHAIRTCTTVGVSRKYPRWVNWNLSDTQSIRIQQGSALLPIRIRGSRRGCLTRYLPPGSAPGCTRYRLCFKHTAVFGVKVKIYLTFSSLRVRNHALSFSLSSELILKFQMTIFHTHSPVLHHNYREHDESLTNGMLIYPRHYDNVTVVGCTIWHMRFEIQSNVVLPLVRRLKLVLSYWISSMIAVSFHVLWTEIKKNRPCD